MANMKVVSRTWTGGCVVACDCGSEEPVEGTAFAGELELMGNEIKSLRNENRELKDQCLEFKRISVMTADEIKEDYLKLGEIMDELSTSRHELTNNLEEISQLRIQLKALKELWVTEYLNRDNDNE